MTVILPPGRSANDCALVGTNLLQVAQFPTGIDQLGIFIDRAGLIAGKPAPTVPASHTKYVNTIEPVG
ncbi:hypothetical protein, partial [Pseudomonas sp. MD195_PC81_125]|uniref:hypothetical protein n=1 Tax=Pseudomonas sp. MD195_PC81_125 TaxID=2741560 RepID=UPI001C70F388